jgi:dTDP-4-dehydrorhamnose 3,5-epimerase
MRRLPTTLEGPVLVELSLHGDERGFFVETYRRSLFAEFGVDDEFVQHNHSRSGRGIVRGMHFQPGMAKLVRVSRGAILDVVVDIRPSSAQFGQWDAHELSDRNGRTLYVPDGFGHGFCVLSDEADVVYGCSSYYDPDTEDGFAYDDPDVGIGWPRDFELIPSARDRAAPRLAEIRERLPYE